MPLPERIPQPVQHSLLELVAMLFKPHRVIVIAPNIEQAIPRPDKFPKSFKQPGIRFPHSREYLCRIDLLRKYFMTCEQGEIEDIPEQY